MPELPVFQDVLAAARRITGSIKRTPVVSAAAFDALVGAEVFFKCENLQGTGAFKLRGATNAVLSLLPEARARGVATHSSGNHGAALAAAAAREGIAAWVVVPENASPAKIENMKRHGASLVFCSPGLANREEGLERVLGETRASVVHPYDDARVIAGQGTATLELLQDEPDIDVLLVPVGGGGLVSGALLVSSALSPTTRVIGVEPEGADDARQSLETGERVLLDNPSTIADGLRASLGRLNFAIISEHIDEIVTVSDAAIERAMAVLEECLRMRVEPSSATVAAALLENKVEVAGKRVGAILSGGNLGGS